MECEFTKYEKTRIIGSRAHQLAGGAPPTVDIGDLDTAVDIAEKEWVERKIPLILVRKYPNGKEVFIDLTK
jgi:DNA-directed RNA polymerase subunit K/omega